jgi:hypothetical protein
MQGVISCNFSRAWRLLISAPFVCQKTKQRLAEKTAAQATTAVHRRDTTMSEKRPNAGHQNILTILKPAERIPAG